MLTCMFPLLLVQCDREIIDQTKPSIGFSKMVDILADIHVAEATFQNLKYHDKDSLANLYYHHIFKLHEIEADEFYKNQQLYFNHPNKLSILYDSVEVVIKMRQKQVKLQKDKPN